MPICDRYFISAAKQTSGGNFDITNAILFTDDGETETILQIGFNYVTAGGWKSKKRVVEPLEVMGEEDGIFEISEECAKGVMRLSGGEIYNPGFYVEPIERGLTKALGLRVF